MKTFQVADIAKPLVPAGRNTSKGLRIVLEDDDACIQRRKTRRRYLYIRVIRVLVVPAKDGVDVAGIDCFFSCSSKSTEVMKAAL